MANIDQIIEDLIKGASRAGAKVEMHDGKGRETKIASAATYLTGAYLQGVKVATQRFKIAFIGQMAGMLGGPAALTAIGKRVPALAGLAKSNMGQMGASMVGSELGERIMPSNR